MAKTDYYRNTLRLLFILVRGSESFRDGGFPDYVRVFDGETRLQALDFWVRYPDYLADELVTEFEKTRSLKYLAAAQKIFNDEEPDLRQVPMMRKYFGAYEPLDTVLGILKSRQLVLPRTKPINDAANHRDFLISQKACDLIDRILVEMPQFRWYDERVKLVLELAGSRGGGALKQRQHEQKEYHDARTGDLIPTIAERVRRRLQMAGDVNAEAERT